VPSAISKVFPKIVGEFFLDFEIGDRSDPNNIELVGFDEIGNAFEEGLKKVEFQDIMYQSLRKPGVQSAVGAVAPTALDIGYGTRPVATTREYSVGTLQQTGNPLDLAIDGDGFFGQQPDGTTAYTATQRQTDR
jgi:flagellar basal body rod protein FlgG